MSGIMAKKRISYFIFPICCVFLIPVVILPLITVGGGEKSGDNVTVSSTSTTRLPLISGKFKGGITAASALESIAVTPPAVRSGAVNSSVTPSVDPFVNNNTIYVWTKIRVLNGSVEDYYDI